MGNRTNQETFRKENIQVDSIDNGFDGRQSLMEIGRGHFAIVYKGITCLR